MRVLSVVVYMT